MAHSQRRWRDLNTPSRVAIIAGSIVQFGLLGAALNDLRKRPADQVNGPKALWTAISFVNFVGPLAYFLFGRRHQAGAR